MLCDYILVTFICKRIGNYTVGPLIVRNITYESTKRKYYDTFMRYLLDKTNIRSIISLLRDQGKDL